MKEHLNFLIWLVKVPLLQFRWFQKMGSMRKTTCMQWIKGGLFVRYELKHIIFFIITSGFLELLFWVFTSCQQGQPISIIFEISNQSFLFLSSMIMMAIVELCYKIYSLREWWLGYQFITFIGWQNWVGVGKYSMIRKRHIIMGHRL